MKVVQSELLNSNWNVVYTYPNFEKKVEKCLIEKGIHCFLPLQKVIRQWHDRKKTLEVPLFPNYIFVLANSINRFRVLNIPGVARYVAFAGIPVVVPQKEIDMIRKLMTEPCLAVEPYFVPGDTVVIEHGPFEGLRGVLVERKGRTRLLIKIDALNKTLSIEICSSVARKTVQQSALALSA